MRVLVIEHDHASPIGPIGERFTDHGYDVVRHPVVAAEHFESPGVTTEFPDFTSFDAVIPMGAPWSTYDHAAVGSWVLPELEQLRAADAAGVPVLGICFGGQLLATAHGGSVAPTERPEVGWYDVESSAPPSYPRGRGSSGTTTRGRCRPRPRRSPATPTPPRHSCCVATSRSSSTPS